MMNKYFDNLQKNQKINTFNPDVLGFKK